jgi:hypothetical protein
MVVGLSCHFRAFSRFGKRTLPPKKIAPRGSARPYPADAVEARFQDANQEFCAVAGGFFGGASVEINAHHAMQ